MNVMIECYTPIFIIAAFQKYTGKFLKNNRWTQNKYRAFKEFDVITEVNK